ncbi:MAG: hypothetical protein J0H11_10120 [Rhizobiales bacterium]|nr:hypothetical protein [Hyphomicrobiales bacterium]
MAISKKLEYSHVDALQLDPQNPRIGRAKRKESLDQSELLKVMAHWTLDELVDSFISSGGFWTQDALMVVREQNDAGEIQTVVEGNRRLAALKMMLAAIRKEIDPPRWLKDRLEGTDLDENNELFTDVPFLVADSRADIAAYLGFRHVTGIKEWAPAEKAEFITKLIEEHGLSYRDVAKQIGSRTDTVRLNYVAFKILLQLEATLDQDEWAEVEDKFSVLFLALRSQGVRHFIGLDLNSAPTGEHDPIPEQKKEDVSRFVSWLFGSKSKKPLVRDSRQVDRFGEMLAEPRAVAYLKDTAEPQFDIAYQLTKGSTDLVIDPLREARRHITLALSGMGERGEEQEVRTEAWPVIEGGVKLALATKGDNLQNARELLNAA